MKHQPEGERNSKSKIEIVITSHDFFALQNRGRNAPSTQRGDELRHRTNTQKRLEKINAEISESIRAYDGSKTENRDPKAYSRFKANSTYYGSGRTCSYGEKTKICDPSCRFWYTCVKGHQIREENKCTE